MTLELKHPHHSDSNSSTGSGDLAMPTEGSLIEQIIRGKEEGYWRRFVWRNGRILGNGQYYEPHELHIDFKQKFTDPDDAQDSIIYCRISTRGGLKGYLVSASGCDGLFDASEFLASISES